MPRLNPSRRYSILPPTRAEFWFKKWFLGVCCSLSLVVYGLHSILSQSSYAIGKTCRTLVFVKVLGFQAVLMGVAFIGFGVALFSGCCTPYSKRLSEFEDLGLAMGLLMMVVGIGWCSWIFLAG
ncbi:MAG: hypothetical protein ACOX9C_07050 [Kiritimatiellia bacterium]|jgi:hypothetical protein